MTGMPAPRWNLLQSGQPCLFPKGPVPNGGAGRTYVRLSEKTKTLLSDIMLPYHVAEVGEHLDGRQRARMSKGRVEDAFR